MNLPACQKTFTHSVFNPKLQRSLFFLQDISKVQRIVTATKSPVNIGVMSRESGGVKECQMEKVSLL